MGQQQLILLVLATVIVGVAIVVGIRAFTENSTKAVADAMVQDLTRMANDAQSWKTKPEQFGGQEDNADGRRTDPDNYAGLTTLSQIGYGGDPYTNLNGSYCIDGTAGDGGVTFAGWNTEKQIGRSITVTGIDDTPASLAIAAEATDPCTATATP